PQSLRLLAFDWSHCHRQPLPKIIFSSLTELHTLSLGLGYPFQLEPNVLPKSLTELELPRNYNLPLLPGALPPHLTELNMGDRYNHPLPAGFLPNSIECL